MNTKKQILFFFITATTLLMSSCDKFLNVQPDNRVMIDTPTKVKQLLINAYPNANYSLLCELSADNLIDLSAPDSTITTSFTNLVAFDRMDDDIFAWKDVVASGGNGDSPYDLWETYYQSIAAANAALQAIDEIIQKGGVSDADMNKILIPCKGEALILRAYSHFMLVNIFAKAYKDPIKSQSDQGIRYVTEPIDVVNSQAPRNSVAEVYDLIAKDIEAGIGLIDNNLYVSAPKYHFNSSAAHAFAAQFYLFKRDYQKVVDNANAVLGANPASVLRSWALNPTNPSECVNAYVDATNPANLLILPTYSVFYRRFFGYKYFYNGVAKKGSMNDGGPTWSSRPPFSAAWMWYFTSLSFYGTWNAKIYEFFEYTDRVAGIGYPHSVRTEYTTDAALLDRAEAYIFLNQTDKAVADLQMWNASHSGTRALTSDIITAFYTPGKPYFSYTFHNADMSSDFEVTPAQKPFVDCVLHFRRLDRFFEGHRWFDIKRYGIELTHRIGLSATPNVLTYDDNRRAIQIPPDVVGAGVQPNPRLTMPAPSDMAVSRDEE